jgi:methyl acetate hydrolase
MINLFCEEETMARSRQTRRKLLQSAAAASAASSLAKFGVTPSWSATAASAPEIPSWVWSWADKNGVHPTEKCPLSLDSVLWIASMTKPVTAVAAMQLVEQGKLQLDEPIKKVLPNLPHVAAPQVLEGFGSDGKPKLRAAKRDITLRHLLTHTSGFTYDIWNADTAKYVKYANLPSITTCKNEALNTPLAFDPGERWEYGISMDYVGKAVETVSKQNLRDYLHEHVFRPLHMPDTDFIIGTDQRRRLATMHERTADGRLKPIQFELPQQPEFYNRGGGFYSGGGGLYGTAGDYMAFLQMLMHGGTFNGQQILRPETVAQMFKNNIGDINISKVVLKTTQPASTPDLDMGTLFPGQDIKWGLSFLMNPQQCYGPWLRSGGSVSWAGLANTYFWLDPVKQVCSVFMTQVLPFLDSYALQLYALRENYVYTLISRV